MSDNKSSSSGIGFTGLLLIAFIVLKLCNVITWSWWWVLSPAWISVLIAVVLLVAIGVLESISARSYENHSKKYSEAARSLTQTMDGLNKTKSKWQQRLDEQMEKNKDDEFRAQNIV